MRDIADNCCMRAGNLSLAEVRSRREHFDNFTFTTIAKEQALEFSRETEAERQIERPQPADPERHEAHTPLYLGRTSSLE